MALKEMTWILLGLFIQYQLLVADKSGNTRDLPVADDGKGNEITSKDNTAKLQQENKGNYAAESSSSFQNDYGSDIDSYVEDKRGLGKWRQLKWSQSGAKRNIGRWKNRKWRDRQSYGQLSGNRDEYGHSLRKRFSEDIEKISDDKLGYATFNGDFILPGLYENFDHYGTEDDFEDIPNNYMDKRHMSRWNLIHRKMANLNSGSKRAGSSFDEKKMASRWRIIHNKLNQLHSGRSKRFSGI